ncbi:MAG: protein translocase subunit SecF, partial [Lentisphaeraceae bacterium]|nr:protein translocase subunit SecF [Lentisphaeraceae bacterium]
LIAMGIYILLGYQIPLPVIAAILTIIGYSLNDTIVVFDRIRENSADIKNKKSFDIMNSSINSTLGRTILTSLTTLLVVVILVIFGGGLIADFAVVLLIGILVGTYSSIFVASPIVCNKLDTHLVKIHEDKADRELKRQNDQTVMVD